MKDKTEMSELVETLRAAAEKAEGGEWKVVKGKGGEGWTICNLGQTRDGINVSVETMGVRASQLRCNAIADAEFIAAASPENILRLLSSLPPSGAASEANLEICKQKEPRKESPWHGELGSGWFWLHGREFGWLVAYVNSKWGAKLDGHYVRMSNFDDCVGPIEEPYLSERSRTNCLKSGGIA